MEIVRCRNDQADVAGEEGEQVDDSIKAPDVAEWSPDRKKSRDVLQRKQDRKSPLERLKESG